MPKNKQLTPPLYRDLLDFYVCDILDYLNDHFAGAKYKDI